MTAQHTPGPWAVIKHESPNGCEYYAIEHKTNLRHGNVVQDLCPTHYETYHNSTTPHNYKGKQHNDEGLANANLIAAAPEMLELIKTAVDQLELVDFSLSANWNGIVTSNALLLLKSAINKAEGRVV